jgi:hypothetical protein
LVAVMRDVSGHFYPRTLFDENHSLLVIGRWKQVPVALHGHLRRGMAGEGHDFLDRESLLDPER